VAEARNFSVESSRKDLKATFETPAMGPKKLFMFQALNNQNRASRFFNRLISKHLKMGPIISLLFIRLLSAVQPLGELRSQQGLHVKVVSAQDIYRCSYN
jgi:hypothetical protein